MKVLSDSGSGSSSGIMAALDEVKRRHLATPGSKSVVSMSLGGTCSGSCSNDPMVLKVQELAEVGIISSLAAGNSNADSILHTPAAAPDAVTVGSTTSSDGKSSFSNHGSLIDVQAPGSSITSVCSRSRSGCADGQSYWTISGTSMACPHVTGVIAQNLEKGTHVAMVDLDAVNQVRASMICDSVKNKISGVPSGTTGDLLQVPTDDGKWACESMGSVDPTIMPTGPSHAPTIAPTSSPTEESQFPEAFKAYTATNTASATQNTVNEDIYVCPGYDLIFSLCNEAGGSCSGDTYLRLFDEAGAEVQANDDSCSRCASIEHSFTAPCQIYSLHQGCWSSSDCGGTVKINHNNPDSPSISPVAAPVTAPTVPSTAPASAPTAPVPSSCPAFTASDTESASQNTVACPVTVCPGTELTFETCDGDGKSCNGDTFMRLKNAQGDTLDLNDDNCGFCSRVSFEFTAQCQEYVT